MTIEENLVEKFNEILKEMESIWRRNAYGGTDWDNLGQQRDGWQRQEIYIREMSQKVEELKSLGVEKVTVEESIRKMLQKVEEDIRRILVNVQLTNTEGKSEQF